MSCECFQFLLRHFCMSLLICVCLPDAPILGYHSWEKIVLAPFLLKSHRGYWLVVCDTKLFSLSLRLLEVYFAVNMKIWNSFLKKLEASLMRKVDHVHQSWYFGVYLVKIVGLASSMLYVSHLGESYCIFQGIFGLLALSCWPRTWVMGLALFPFFMWCKRKD